MKELKTMGWLILFFTAFLLFISIFYHCNLPSIPQMKIFFSLYSFQFQPYSWISPCTIAALSQILKKETLPMSIQENNPRDWKQSSSQNFLPSGISFLLLLYWIAKPLCFITTQIYYHSLLEIRSSKINMCFFQRLLGKSIHLLFPASRACLHS